VQPTISKGEGRDGTSVAELSEHLDLSAAGWLAAGRPAQRPHSDYLAGLGLLGPGS
jgi:hypothetical protein